MTPEETEKLCGNLASAAECAEGGPYPEYADTIDVARDRIRATANHEKLKTLVGRMAKTLVTTMGGEERIKLDEVSRLVHECRAVLAGIPKGEA